MNVLEFEFWLQVLTTGLYGIVAIRFWNKSFHSSRDVTFNVLMCIHFFVIVIRAGLLAVAPDFHRVDWVNVHRVTIFLAAIVPYLNSYLNKRIR